MPGSGRRTTSACRPVRSTRCARGAPRQAPGGTARPGRATKTSPPLADPPAPPRLPRLGAAPNVDYGIDGTKLHGVSGLGGTDFPCAPLHHLPPSEKLLVDLVRQHPHD